MLVVAQWCVSPCLQCSASRHLPLRFVRRHQDLAVYKIIGMLSHLEIAEMCARSGANCGSIFLDLRFRELVKTLLADHPVHLDG